MAYGVTHVMVWHIRYGASPVQHNAVYRENRTGLPTVTVERRTHMLNTKKNHHRATRTLIAGKIKTAPKTEQPRLNYLSSAICCFSSSNAPTNLTMRGTYRFLAVAFEEYLPVLPGRTMAIVVVVVVGEHDDVDGGDDDDNAHGDSDGGGDDEDEDKGDGGDGDE